MAKVSLASLSEIDGFVAAALVDSESGLALAIQGTAGIDLELAAAGNTEVIRAKRKVAKALNINRSVVEQFVLDLDTATTNNKILQNRKAHYKDIDA